MKRGNIEKEATEKDAESKRREGETAKEGDERKRRKEKELER